MAIQLEGDDFYRLPKHVQEQLRAQGLGPEPEGPDLDEVERQRSQAIEDAEAARIATEARYRAMVEDPAPVDPEPPERQPEPPDKGCVLPLLAWAVGTFALSIAAFVPVEISALFGAMSVGIILVHLLT